MFVFIETAVGEFSNSVLTIFVGAGFVFIGGEGFGGSVPVFKGVGVSAKLCSEVQFQSQCCCVCALNNQ